MINTGLIGRYYLDEAASGTGPTTVVDASPNGYHLTEINYGSATLAYTEVSGQRGLDSLNIAGSHRARRAVDNASDALRDALAGVQKATIELVIQLTTGNDNGGRIFGVNDRVGGGGTFILRAPAAADTTLNVARGGSASGGSSAIGTTRCVVHAVLDTTQATAADRLRLYKNGTLLSSLGDDTVTPLNATLTIPSDVDLIALNREDAGAFARSIDGVLHYAAMYAHAFSAGEADENATELLADDDTPVVAPSAGGPFAGGQTIYRVHPQRWG